MPIKEGKERYFVTLTQDKAMCAKRSIEKLGLPSQHFSILMDEYLDIINPILLQLIEARATGEKLTAGDILQTVTTGLKKAEDKSKY